MDPFIKFFTDNADIFRLVSIILSIVAAVVTVVTLIIKYRPNGLLKRLMEWATTSFADGKITKDEFSQLMNLLKHFKETAEAVEEKTEDEKSTVKVEATKTGKVKKEKAAKVKVREEKDTKNKWRAVIKDANGVILFTKDFKCKFKARNGVKKALKQLITDKKVPATYKLTKI